MIAGDSKYVKVGDLVSPSVFLWSRSDPWEDFHIVLSIEPVSDRLEIYSLRVNRVAGIAAKNVRVIQVL